MGVLTGLTSTLSRTICRGEKVLSVVCSKEYILHTLLLVHVCMHACMPYGGLRGGEVLSPFHLSLSSRLILSTPYLYFPSQARKHTHPCTHTRTRHLTHLVTVFRVQKDPPELNDFCRVLGDIDAMFIARRSYMYDYIAVEVAALSRWCSHCEGYVAVFYYRLLETRGMAVPSVEMQ